MWKTRWHSLRPAGSPKDPVSARACLWQLLGSASLGQSAAWAALTGHIMGLAFDTGGGHWCKQLNGWIFPEDKRDQVVAAMGDDISEEQVSHVVTPTLTPNPEP